MRHAGVGFPNGPVSNDAVFALPSPDLLMLAPEGRYHHDAAVRAGRRILWRAIPRLGKRPAELGWSPARFVEEALNLTDEPSEPIRDFVFANELDLQDERGDREDDWSDLEQRYALIGGWALSVLGGLRAALPGTRLHWPAWTPDHHALGYLSRWQAAAERCDVVDFHAYDSLSKIQSQYAAYRLAFPSKPLSLTEWHCKGDLDEERRVLAWLADTMASDPLFEAAYFFIWRWHNAPGWWSAGWDVEHSTERLALFMNPPVASLPEPEPQPEPEPAPMPECPSRDDLREYGLAQARQKNIPEALYDRQIKQESNWQHCAADGSLKVSSGNAVGVAQIIQRWHPDVDVTDPWASLRYSTTLMAGHFARFGSWRKALAAYNWGPANVSGYTDGAGRVHPAWDGSRAWACPHVGVVSSCKTGQLHHYLDVILGVGWPEPGAQPTPLPPVSATVYERYDDEHPAGALAACDGVILHGSRSGTAGNTLEQEYAGTARYEVENAAGLGWNATIGPGRVALHLPADRWGWNARAASSRYVAVEIAQPTVDTPLSPAVAIACADYIFDHVWPRWGELWHFPSHAEVEAWGETGQRDGKTDLYPAGDERMNDFRELVYAQLRRRQEAAVPAPEPEPEPAPAPPTDEVAGLRVAIAHLCDVVIPRAAAAAAEREAALAEAAAIREQFLGPAA